MAYKRYGPFIIVPINELISASASINNTGPSVVVYEGVQKYAGMLVVVDFGADHHSLAISTGNEPKSPWIILDADGQEGGTKIPS